jgi:predicted PurR-regulated permease PerM
MLSDFLKNKKLMAGIITVVLLLFILYASIPYLSAFFGAVILAFIFRPIDKKLKRFVSPSLSAAIILAIALLLIIIPLIFIINGLIDQVALLPEQIENIKLLKDRIEEILPVNIEMNEQQLIDQIVPILTSSIQPAFTNILSLFAILFLLFFVMYYLILYYDKIKIIIMEYLPFTRKNNLVIIEKFKEITYATIVGTFLIAIIQGGLLALNFWLLGIPNALFWGAVTMILSFLPLIGAPIIWIPAALIQFLSGNTNIGVALIVVGIFISLIDNILRPIINQQYGSIHPLVSIIGIFIGISQFGIVGIFIGPLLIAYFLLFFNLYMEEYLGQENIIKKAVR